MGLFHSNFDGALSSSMALAQSQWMHGFIDRSDGLRAVAQSYDSPLFERLAENIIRSLRFGTSLAGNLSLLASEARAIRRKGCKSSGKNAFACWRIDPASNVSADHGAYYARFNARLLMCWLIFKRKEVRYGYVFEAKKRM